MRYLATALLLATAASASADGHLSTAPANAVAYIISPANGEVVPTTFTVKFGLAGMGVAPAGVLRENTGHHHLLINAEELPQRGQPMGGDVKHFGGGQTETTITLDPGTHTLQLVLGNHVHIPHEPMVFSEPITVFVRQSPQ